MKRWFAVLLALALLAVATIPVMAAPEAAQRSPRGPFTLVGTIATIDPVAGTVTVNVLRGNLLVKPYLGKTLTLNTAVTTIYLYKATATATPVRITFADLKVGDPISVNGTLLSNVWTATRITVGASLLHYP